MTSATHPVPKHRAARRVLTVLGPIEPARAGVTLTHEHLLIDFTAVLASPTEASDRALMHEKVGLHNLGWIRYNWTSNVDNLQILDEEITIREASAFYRAGGDTIVDVTSIGLARDPLALVRISRATGLNVVMGSGYYIDQVHPAGFDSLGVDDVARAIVHDVDKGVGATGVRSGIIGEIGCSWPWTDGEKKAVEAGVVAQRETGAPLLIHPGRNPRAPLETLNAVQKWGGDMSRTVMAHIERTIFDRGVLKETAAAGSYMNLDLFGHDSSFYPLDPAGYMPGDHQRIDQIEYLMGEGAESRVLLAHDICSKHRLKTYGGHGWDHILTRVVPRMRERGFTEEQIRLVIVDNPTRMLTFD